MESVARLPPVVGSTLCRPVARASALPVTQVKLRPSSSWVTRQTAGGTRGCRIRARLPTRSGPASSRRMLVTEGVHSAQRSPSIMTAHTRSGGAEMSTLML